MTDKPMHVRDLSREAYHAARAQIVADATAASTRLAPAHELAALRRKYPEAPERAAIAALKKDSI